MTEQGKHVEMGIEQLMRLEHRYDAIADCFPRWCTEPMPAVRPDGIETTAGRSPGVRAFVDGEPFETDRDAGDDQADGSATFDWLEAPPAPEDGGLLDDFEVWTMVRDIEQVYELYSMVLPPTLRADLRNASADRIHRVGRLVRSTLGRDLHDLVDVFERVPTGEREVAFDELEACLDDWQAGACFRGYRLFETFASILREVVARYWAHDAPVGEGLWEIGHYGDAFEPVGWDGSRFFGVPILTFHGGSRLHLVEGTYAKHRAAAAFGDPRNSGLCGDRRGRPLEFYGLADAEGRGVALFAHPTIEGIDVVSAQGREASDRYWQQLETLRFAIAVLRKTHPPEDLSDLPGLLLRGIPDGAYHVRTWQGYWDEGLSFVYNVTVHFTDGMISSADGPGIHGHMVVQDPDWSEVHDIAWYLGGGEPPQPGTDHATR